jgi:hypothetical protein
LGGGDRAPAREPRFGLIVLLLIVTRATAHAQNDISMAPWVENFKIDNFMDSTSDSEEKYHETFFSKTSNSLGKKGPYTFHSSILILF